MPCKIKDLCKDLDCVIELSKGNKFKKKHSDQLQIQYFLSSSVVYDAIRTISNQSFFLLQQNLEHKKKHSQAKTNQQNKSKQTKTTKATIFCAEKLLRGWKSFVLCFLKKIEIVLIASVTILLNYVVSTLLLSNYFYPFSTHKTPYTLFKHKRKNEKISLFTLFIFLCLCASTFLRFIENSPQCGNCMCCCLLIPSCPNLGRTEKINLNFYFHNSLCCLKRFYEGLKDLHKTFWDTKKNCENKNLSCYFNINFSNVQDGKG